MLADAQKTNTSRTSLLNKLILEAWKERWRDFEFAINVKNVSFFLFIIKISVRIDSFILFYLYYKMHVI